MEKHQYEYDIMVIGAGPGGYVTAIKAAQLGFKTLIVEKEYLGGVCLNVGCIPTKTLLKNSHVYDMVAHADKFGIQIDQKIKPKVDWAAMQNRKQKVVSTLTAGVKGLLKKNKVTSVWGEAIPVDAHTITVNKKKYQAEYLILATGSTPRHMPFKGAEQAREAGLMLDSTSVLSLPKLPTSMIVIGGGVIGVEFACMFAELGVEVTILQGLPKILELLDNDISVEMTKILTKEKKVQILPNAFVQSVVTKNNQISVTYEDQIDHKMKTVTADYCLESVGRVPYLGGFANKLNLKTVPRIEALAVNEFCETNVPKVYAIGDVNAKLMLAHTASAQGIAVIETIAGISQKINLKHIPSVIYSHPEVASVGITEEQAKEQKLAFKTFKYPLRTIGKAIADGEIEGFAKLIVSAKYGEILGAHIICATAGDMINEMTGYMTSEATLDEIVHTVRPHPTLSEMLTEVAHGLDSKPIHM